MRDTPKESDTFSRDRLNRDVDAFLARGGQITVVPTGQGAEGNDSYNRHRKRGQNQGTFASNGFTKQGEGLYGYPSAKKES